MIPPNTASKMSNVFESKGSIGSWALRVSVTGPTSRVTASHSSISFVISGLQMSIGSSSSTGLAWTSDSSLNASVPVGFGRNKVLSVASGGGELQVTNVSFSYRDPVLLGVNQSMANSSVTRTASTAVILQGKFFAFQDASSRAAIRPSSCRQSNWLSDTSVQCRQSIGNVAMTISMSIGGLTSSAPSVLQRSKPDITSLSFMPWKQLEISTGAVNVAVSGINFVTHRSSAKIFVGSSAAVASIWLSDSSMLCKLSHSISSSIPYRLSVKSLSSATLVPQRMQTIMAVEGQVCASLATT